MLKNRQTASDNTNTNTNTSSNSEQQQQPKQGMDSRQEEQQDHAVLSSSIIQTIGAQIQSAAASALVPPPRQQPQIAGLSCSCSSGSGVEGVMTAMPGEPQIQQQTQTATVVQMPPAAGAPVHHAAQQMPSLSPRGCHKNNGGGSEFGPTTMAQAQIQLQQQQQQQPQGVASPHARIPMPAIASETQIQQQPQPQQATGSTSGVGVLSGGSCSGIIMPGGTQMQAQMPTAAASAQAQRQIPSLSPRGPTTTTATAAATASTMPTIVVAGVMQQQMQQPPIQQQQQQELATQQQPVAGAGGGGGGMTMSSFSFPLFHPSSGAAAQHHQLQQQQQQQQQQQLQMLVARNTSMYNNAWGQQQPLIGGYSSASASGIMPLGGQKNMGTIPGPSSLLQQQHQQASLLLQPNSVSTVGQPSTAASSTSASVAQAVGHTPAAVGGGTGGGGGGAGKQQQEQQVECGEKIHISTSLGPDAYFVAKKRRDYRHEAFPEKLYRMLLQAESEGRSHVVAFTERGTAIDIIDADAFLKDVIPNYFRHKRLSSFRRQLSMYGFKRVKDGPDQGAYAHELFIRGRPDLLKQIKRVAEMELVLPTDNKSHPQQGTKSPKQKK